jgi:hypothetical protein
LALQLVIQARLQGIAFGWVGADSLYDEDPRFFTILFHPACNNVIQFLSGIFADSRAFVFIQAFI